MVTPRPSVAGQAYTSGWQTDLYDAMTPDEQDEINDQTDRSFAGETGIERALDGGSSVDKVLVRRWLRLRDEVVETGIARVLGPEDRRRVC